MQQQGSVCQRKNHNNGLISRVCMNSRCKSKFRLSCAECVIEDHNEHLKECVPLEQLKTQAQDIKLQDIKNSIDLQKEKDRIETFLQQVEQEFQNRLSLLKEIIPKNLESVNMDQIRDQIKTVKVGGILQMSNHEINNLIPILQNTDKFIQQQHQKQQKLMSIIQQLTQPLSIWMSSFKDSKEVAEIDVADFKSSNEQLQQFYERTRVNYDNVPDNFKRLSGMQTKPVKFQNSEMYYGEMTTGKPHGKGNLSYYFLNKSLKIGTLIEKYGIILEGIFEHGEMKWGTVYTYNREGMICTQTGCMRQKRNEGETIIKVYNKNWKLQESFEGTMSQGLKSGYGIQNYMDGSRYEGYWKMGKQSGQGTYFYASGAKYEGSWVNGASQGFGVYYYTNGARYEGEWARDRKQGQGTYFFTNGDREVGQYSESKSEGEHRYYNKENKLIKIRQYKNGKAIKDEYVNQQQDDQQQQGDRQQVDEQQQQQDDNQQQEQEQ